MVTQYGMRPDQMYAAIICLAALGYGLNRAFVSVERRLVLLGSAAGRLNRLRVTANNGDKIDMAGSIGLPFEYGRRRGDLFRPWLENSDCPVAEQTPSQVDMIVLSHGHFDQRRDALKLALWKSFRCKDRDACRMSAAGWKTVRTGA